MVFLISEKKQKKFYILTAVLCLCAILGGILFYSFFSGYSAVSNSIGAMGTVISVKIFGNSDSRHFTALYQIFDQVEQASSLTIPNSALSLLNTTGSTQDKILLAQAKICREVYDASGGAFDCTVCPVSSLWGIGTDQARVPEPDEISKALCSVNGAELQINEETLWIGKNQKADFGAVGKGYACDAALAYLKGTDIPGAVIAVGGSILLYGKSSPAGAGFTVAVRDPFGTQTDFAGILKLQEGFISTSGDYERFFMQNGVRYHHILDPKTGFPAQSGLTSVTVITKDSGTLSDALSTACFVLGLEKGFQLLQDFNAEGIFITQEGTVYVTDGLCETFTLTAAHLKMGELS